MLRLPRFGAIVLLLALTSSALWAKKERVSRRQRGKYLSRVSFVDRSAPNILSAGTDLLKLVADGPSYPKAVITQIQNQEVTCRFKPEREGDTNPKFHCWLTDARGRYFDASGEAHDWLDKKDRIKLKVKYRQLQNPDLDLERDMYTEVFASHLLWLLGFGADRVYPTQAVNCLNCPENPFEDRSEDFGKTRRFVDAAVEFKFPGTKVYSRFHQGWAFPEIVDYRHEWTKETRMHFDALVLLMGILVHSSNRESQQRLVCPGKDDLSLCQPYAIVHDLGSVLGSQKKILALSHSKADHESWQDFPLWADEEECEVALQFARKTVFGDRLLVAEEGRLYLLERLRHLLDHPTLGSEPLRRLLAKSKFEKADQLLIERLGESDPDRYYQVWIDAFRNKVEELASRTCRREG